MENPEKKLAVEWFLNELLESKIIATDNYDVYMFRKAKEMHKEQNISLLEWIRNNAVEVQGGWQHDGWTYTDKEILEVYYKKQKQ
jgi:hypothetical protein